MNFAPKTEYQKGGIDLRSWALYEIATMQAERAAPGDRPETPEEAAVHAALEELSTRIAAMELSPEQPQMAQAVEILRQRALSNETQHETQPEEFPFS